MVFTLHKYIFRELIKIFVLTSLALTVMMSFGIILRPVQQYGVGPRQVVHLLGYFLPIILTYVLPMAALFAGSLVYGRFASDNELNACKASGISPLTMVYPGFALAVMVSIANLILSFYVIPTFVQHAERSIKADAQKIIFRNIQRKGYYKSADGRYLIYADQTDPKNEMLSGVVITEVRDGSVGKIISAESARVHFNPHMKFNEVQITAYNIYQMGFGEDGGFSMEQMSISKEFPPMLGDDISFKKIDEMKKIRVNPIRFNPIAKIASEVYAQFSAELLAQDINAQKASNPNSFYKLYSGRKFIEINSDICMATDEKQVELSGNVVVIEYDSSKEFLRTLRSDRALLHIAGDELAATLMMEIYNPRWQRVDGSEGLAGRQIVHGLILPPAVTEKFETENVLDSINPRAVAAALGDRSTAKLNNLQEVLRKEIVETLIDIRAEIHSRLVFGIGCISLVMIGIGLGIIKKGGHLLSAFGISSLPAAVLIVCIMMGKNIAKNTGSQTDSGIMIMWVALVLLCVLTAVIYRKLLKN